MRYDPIERRESTQQSALTGGGLVGMWRGLRGARRCDARVRRSMHRRFRRVSVPHGRSRARRFPPYRGQRDRAADPRPLPGAQAASWARATLAARPRRQCHLALPMSFNEPAVGRSHAGLGDVELGVNIDPQPSRRRLVRCFVSHPGPAYRRRRQEPWNGCAQLLLPLWIQRSSGEWRDAGIARLLNRAPDARNAWFAGLLARRSFGERLRLGVELYRRTSVGAGEPSISDLTSARSSTCPRTKTC